MRYKVLSKDGIEIKNLSRRTAIRHKCWDCSGWNYAEIKDCEHTDCELHPYRMGKLPKDKTSTERSQTIREYCSWCSNGESEKKHCPCKDCSLFPFRMSQTDKSVEIT